jgi:hypothetical protein
MCGEQVGKNALLWAFERGYGDIADLLTGRGAEYFDPSDPVSA